MTNGSDMELLTNKTLTLRPAVMQHKEKIFTWLTDSNLTSDVLGPPKFADNPIPTWEEFDADYTNHYFDGILPLKRILFHHHS